MKILRLSIYFIIAISISLNICISYAHADVLPNADLTVADTLAKEQISSLVGDNTLPNPLLTPGALSPDVVRNVTAEELCTTSTKTVRDVGSGLHAKVYAEYDLTGNHAGYCRDDSKYIEGTNTLKDATDKDEGCEVDHDCSLELGCNNDIKNLWPQPYFGACNAHQKDALENKLHKLICNGTITMQEAQSEISTNWIEAYAKYVDAKGCQ